MTFLSELQTQDSLTPQIENPFSGLNDFLAAELQKLTVDQQHAEAQRRLFQQISEYVADFFFETFGFDSSDITVTITRHWDKVFADHFAIEVRFHNPVITDTDMDAHQVAVVTKLQPYLMDFFHVDNKSGGMVGRSILFQIGTPTSK